MSVLKFLKWSRREPPAGGMRPSEAELEVHARPRSLERLPSEGAEVESGLLGRVSSGLRAPGALPRVARLEGTPGTRSRMLKLSTLVLGAGLVVGSAVLAGLWQAKSPRPSTTTARKPAPAAVETRAEPATDKGQPGVRSVYPGLVPGSAAPQRSTGEQVSPPPAASRPEVASSLPSDTRAAPPPASPPGPPPGPAEIAAADPNAAVPPAAGGAPTGRSVDLNTGSVEDLNRLGAGMIGRRIIGGRPYTSPDDLVTRRVLTKRDFDLIKAQVVVQSAPAAAQ